MKRTAAPPPSQRTPGRGLRRALALALLPLAAQTAQAGTKLTGGSLAIARHDSGSAGQSMQAGTVVLNNRVGQVGIQSAAGGSFKMERGLMPLAAQPGSVVSITAVTKATGTLDLSWSAPGLDGFQGGVIGGFYRVDFSSDPTHAFQPGAFQLEFSTTVTPGSLESLQIQGLEPNTTYFTRIYLADARKFFAEDSARSDESTLANAPVNPSVVAVSSTHAILSWLVPAGAAEGYRTESSSTNFGALAPGGALISSVTPNGLLVQLTLDGLEPGTTYYFRVASFNWQGQRNFSETALSVVTSIRFAPAGVSLMGTGPSALGRSVTLTWTNPVDPALAGVLVLLSTNPVVSVANGASFGPGQSIGDGSIVKSTAIAASLRDSGLLLDTTFYYHIFTQNAALVYSIRVSTSVFLDLAPMAPSGLVGAPASDHASLSLAWKPVKSNLDGSPFLSAATPAPLELARYEIHRSTTFFRPNFVKIATVSAANLAFTDTLPDPNKTFLYRISAVDSLGNSDASMAVNSDGDLYVFAPDEISHLRVPRALVPELRQGSNSLGSDVLLRGVDEPAGGADRAFRAVRFEAVKSPGGEALGRFQFSRPDSRVSLRYEVSDGQVVPSGPLASLASLPRVSASQADGNLGLFWNNGAKFVKLFGTVDTQSQIVSVPAALTGSYQIRPLLRSQSFSFDLSTLSNKVITPNGDGFNDAAVLRFENPKASAFSGKIFDVAGAEVAEMSPGPAPESLQWDGKAGGHAVSGGVYVYQVRAEDKVFTGTLLVIR